MNGSNYLIWEIDVEIKLNDRYLDRTNVQPKAGNDERTILDKAKALHFLQYHIHSDLKFEYMNEDDLVVL